MISKKQTLFITLLLSIFHSINGQNLLKNGSFENWTTFNGKDTPESWTINVAANREIDIDIANGNTSLGLYTNSYSPIKDYYSSYFIYAPNDDINARRDMALQTGNTYSIKFSYRTEGDPISSVDILFNSLNSSQEDPELNIIANNDGEWHDVFFEFNVDSNSLYTLNVNAVSQSPNAKIVFDNFELYNYNEESEYNSLAAIFEAFNGRNWKEPWDLTKHPSTWIGVTRKSSGGGVERLNLQDENLSGILSPSIENLSDLRFLYILSENLVGEIPPEIYSLSNLRTIILQGNLEGEITPKISELNLLQNLTISCFDVNGGITGTIPNSIGSLTNLTNLSLQIPNLTGSIPKELGNLTNLTSLRLVNNKLSGSIPESIGNLTNLTKLWLHNNNLSGTIPSEIANLINLTELSLSRNELSGTIPSQIGNLTELNSLRLSLNSLSGSIPTSIAGLTKLIELRLDNNQLSGSIPETIGSMSNLEALIL